MVGIKVSRESLLKFSVSMEKLCKAVQYVMTQDICSVFLDFNVFFRIGQVLQHLLHLFTSISMIDFHDIICYYDILL